MVQKPLSLLLCSSLALDANFRVQLVLYRTVYLYVLHAVVLRLMVFILETVKLDMLYVQVRPAQEAKSNGPKRVIRGRSARRALAAEDRARVNSGSTASSSGRPADFSFLTSEQQQVCVTHHGHSTITCVKMHVI